MENNLDKKILNKIKNQDLAPKPRWHFVVKNYLIWIFGALSLIVGSLAVSVIIYILKYSDWLMHKEMNTGLLEFLVLALPYFWLIILALFISLVQYNIKHTKKGYKHSLVSIFILSVGLSVLLGTMFYQIGLGQAIDDILSEKAPIYTRALNRHIDFWSCPEKGRLSGLIVANISDLEYILLDKENKEWLFNIERLENEPIQIMVGRPIRSLGELQEENKFMATQIMTMGPGRGLFRRPEHNVPIENLKLFRSRLSPPPIDSQQEIRELFKKYPELEQAVKERTEESQEKIKDIIKNNPEIILKLEKLNILSNNLLDN